MFWRVTFGGVEEILLDMNMVVLETDEAFKFDLNQHFWLQILILIILTTMDLLKNLVNAF